MKLKKLSEFQDIYSRMYEGKLSKSVTFIVTHQCNLRCTYCYEHHKSDEHMTLDTAKKIVDFLFEEDSKNSREINSEKCHGIILEFIGGEPLLEIELINDTMNYFLNKAIMLNHRWATNYMISITTNGILGDNELVKKFINKYKERLSISVTIDGDKEAHDACRIDCNGNGSYDRAIKMFRDLSRDYNYKKTKYTIAPGNLNHFKQSVINFIEDEKIDIIHCNCVFEEGWTIEHAKKLYKELKDISNYILDNGYDTYLSIFEWRTGRHLPDNDTTNWCGGDGRMLAFEPDGSILPCMRFSKMSLGDNQLAYRIGDINNGIAVLKEDKNRLDKLQSITRQSQSTQECLDCPINEGCAWCTAYNYEISGTPNFRATYICCMHKARVLAQCYHWNKRHILNNIYDPKQMNIPKEWALEIISEDEYNMLKNLEKEAFKDIDISKYPEGYF